MFGKFNPMSWIARIVSPNQDDDLRSPDQKSHDRMMRTRIKSLRYLRGDSQFEIWLSKLDADGEASDTQIFSFDSIPTAQDVISVLTRIVPPNQAILILRLTPTGEEVPIWAWDGRPNGLPRLNAGLDRALLDDTNDAIGLCDDIEEALYLGGWIDRFQGGNPTIICRWDAWERAPIADDRRYRTYTADEIAQMRAEFAAAMANIQNGGGAGKNGAADKPPEWLVDDNASIW